MWLILLNSPSQVATGNAFWLRLAGNYFLQLTLYGHCCRRPAWSIAKSDWMWLHWTKHFTIVAMAASRGSVRDSGNRVCRFNLTKLLGEGGKESVLIVWTSVQASEWEESASQLLRLIWIKLQYLINVGQSESRNTCTDSLLSLCGNSRYCGQTSDPPLKAISRGLTENDSRYYGHYSGTKQTILLFDSW